VDGAQPIGVGAITESDVLLALTSNAIVIGFNVRPERNAEAIAEQEKIDIRLHTIIYNLIDEIKQAMTGLLAPVFREVYQGKAEVRDTFRISKVGLVAGWLAERRGRSALSVGRGVGPRPRRASRRSAPHAAGGLLPGEPQSAWAPRLRGKRLGVVRGHLRSGPPQRPRGLVERAPAAAPLRESKRVATLGQVLEPRVPARPRLTRATRPRRGSRGVRSRRSRARSTPVHPVALRRTRRSRGNAGRARPGSRPR